MSMKSVRAVLTAAIAVDSINKWIAESRIAEVVWLAEPWKTTLSRQGIDTTQQ